MEEKNKSIVRVSLDEIAKNYIDSDNNLTVKVHTLSSLGEFREAPASTLSELKALALRDSNVIFYIGRHYTSRSFSPRNYPVKN